MPTTYINWTVTPGWDVGTRYKVNAPRRSDNGQVVTIHRDVVIVHEDGTTRRIDRAKLVPAS